MGLAVHFGKLINKGGLALQKGISRFVKTSSDVSEAEFEATLVTCITLFCASGTGIYGSIIAGMSADHSVLIAKAILDLFTAVVFACTLGMVTAAVAIPQFIIFFILFLLGGPIYNGLDLGTNTYIINDFKACGGFIMLATGFRMCKIKQFPVADMIPAMVLIFPIAIFWNDCVTPAVNMLAGMVHCCKKDWLWESAAAAEFHWRQSCFPSFKKLKRSKRILYTQEAQRLPQRRNRNCRWEKSARWQTLFMTIRISVRRLRAELIGVR